MRSGIKISKEERAEMLSEIHNFFLTERDEDLGLLACGIILDFFMAKLADRFYNLGVRDAHQYLTRKLDELFELEL